MHGSQHRSDELVNPETLLDEGYQCRDLAFVVGGTSETVEDEFLERLDLILERHEIHDCLVPST